MNKSCGIGDKKWVANSGRPLPKNEWIRVKIVFLHYIEKG